MKTPKSSTSTATNGPSCPSGSPADLSVLLAALGPAAVHAQVPTGVRTRRWARSVVDGDAQPPAHVPGQLSRPRWDAGVTVICGRAFVAGGTIALDLGGRPIPTSIIDLFGF